MQFNHLLRKNVYILNIYYLYIFFTQSWEEFVKEIKTVFSDKSKAADVKWKIETFKQGKKHIVDFMIEFEMLAMKVDTDDLHAIFLLKKNV